MPRILLTHTPDALRLYYGERAVARLKTLGEVRLHSSDRVLSTPELIDAARGCEVIVSHRQAAGEAELFHNSPDLVAFVRCAIDIRNIDVAAASTHGILVTQASAGFIPSVSEWIIAAMIDVARNISDSVVTYRQGKMPLAVMGGQLAGSTLGIIGYGQIARYLAPLALAFGMRVLVSDPYAKVEDVRLEQTDLKTLLGESDHVVCLAVATAETENLMNAKTFGQMKRGAFFINASRGNLVDDAALRQALDQGQLAGCAMDVGRAPDQMPTPELARHPKVVATPHIGGLTPQAIEHQSLETVAQTAEILKGRAPKGAVNADKATRLARLR
jgi:D-3-phosphoglycerate dehydrogenase